MIITIQFYRISIPQPQRIPLPPKLSPLETVSFSKSVSQYLFCEEVHTECCLIRKEEVINFLLSEANKMIVAILSHSVLGGRGSYAARATRTDPGIRKWELLKYKPRAAPALGTLALTLSLLY